MNLDNESSLPHVFVKFKTRIHEKNGTEAKISQVLLDSGSQVNVVSINKLKAIGLNENNIQSCQKYNLKSSTETTNYCILGTINVNMH